MPQRLGAWAKVRSTRPPGPILARLFNSLLQAFALARLIAYDQAMDQARMDRAMARIEVALSRIESVPAAPPPAATGPSETQTALRERVEGAISQLDALIGSLEK
ncbi:hypothetical protein [Qipengyuania sp.]|uniref:hypothetical protein n=1 Tax=Qipengyuania sp. TaxID=2004515 RepID=UPI0035C7BBD6